MELKKFANKNKRKETYIVLKFDKLKNKLT